VAELEYSIQVPENKRLIFAIFMMKRIWYIYQIRFIIIIHLFEHFCRSKPSYIYECPIIEFF